MFKIFKEPPIVSEEHNSPLIPADGSPTGGSAPLGLASSIWFFGIVLSLGAGGKSLYNHTNVSSSLAYNFCAVGG